MKRTCIFCLAAVLLSAFLFLFCSCEEETERPGLQSSGITVWSETEFPLPAEYMFAGDKNNIRSYNGRIYIDTWKIVEGEDGGETVESVTVSWNTDGTDFRDETDADRLQPAVEGASVLYAVSLGDGSTATYEILPDVRGMIGWFCVRDEKDRLLFSVDLPDCFGEDYGDERTVVSGGGLQFRGAAVVGNGNDRKYLAAASSGLVCFDRNGEVLHKLTPCDVNAVTVIGDTVYFFQNGDPNTRHADGTTNSLFLFAYDADTGERGADIALPSVIASSAGELFGGYAEGCPAYWKNGAGLYGLSITEAEDGTAVCESTLMIDWNESDIFGDRFEDFYVLDNDTACAVSMTLDTSLPHSFSTTFSIMHRLPPKVLEGQIRLEAAALSPFDVDLLRAKAVQFNRSHPGCHITVTDRLSEYNGSYDTARTQLDMEIAAGDIPDILFISQHTSVLSTAEDYVRAGVFCDLVPLAGESAVFDYDDLPGCLKQPFTDDDGRQFLLPTSLISDVLVSNGSTVTGPMTAGEAMAYYETLPDTVHLLTNDPSALKQFLSLAMVDDLIDETAGTCSFDDGRFARMLRFCEEKKRSVQKENLPTARPDAQRVYVRSGDLILLGTSGIMDLLDYVELEYALGGCVVPVGYPNEQRLVYGSPYYGAYIGITETCEHKAEALEYLWEFYKPTETTRANSHGMEVSSSMTRTGIYAQADVLAGYTIVNADDEHYRKLVPNEEASDYPGAQRAITREDADHFLAFLDSVGKIASSTGPVWDIINDELYSSARAEPEKIADVIQSRVSLYLSE